jgi:hypothetical protein
MITQDKIKVFISSKCGGERVNYEHLVTADSEDKKAIAEKAVKTSYDLVRRALKSSFEATGFISTYVFEDGDASTLPTREDYLFELDKSDVCLFLIDNFDGTVPEGILAEIDRAQQRKKKSIYLFLNHPGREQTSIQRGLIGSTGIRYREINDIREFIDEGYRSVVNDVLTIYQMYCGGRLTIGEQTTSSVEIVEADFPVETSNIDKQIFSRLGLTRNKIASFVFPADGKAAESSEIDKSCLLVLEALLGEKEFNEDVSATLLEELGKIQPSRLHEIVRERWRAISNFYAGNLDGAIAIIDSIYQTYSEDVTVPKWLINDILIDWRNLSTINDQRKNVIGFSVQDKIEKQNSLIFFPLVDRFSTNINDDIWKRNLSDLISSPYSTTFYNLDTIFGYITNYLFAAVYYGSYTHVLFTLREIQKVLLNLVQTENNLLSKIQLMRVSILLGDETDFPKLMDKYRSSLSHSTEKEVLDLYKLADTKPSEHQRAGWKVLLFMELGYYFSDTNYETVTNELLGLSREWIREETPNISLVDKFIKALMSNKARLPQEEMVGFALEVFRRKHYRFLDSTLDLLSQLGFSEVSQDLLSDLLSQIKAMLENEEIRQRDPSMKNLLTRIRKNRDDLSEEIDALVQKYYPEFFTQEYRLEVIPGDRATHIQRYLESIRARNKVQGKGGRYIGYVDNPYLTIKNIIEIGEVVLSEELLGDLLTEITNTLFSETQTYREKINAIQVLLFLKQQVLTFSYAWSDYYSNIKQNVVRLRLGHSSFFEQDSGLVLHLYTILLQLAFGEDSLQDVLEILALINNSSDRDIIESLVALDEFLKTEKGKLVDSSLISVLVQYTSAFCFREDDSIRYHTVHVLYRLIDSQYANFVVSRLAKMMDDNDFEVKWAIINQASLIKKHSIETFNYILGKAKIDNNYLVRRALNKYSSEASV